MKSFKDYWILGGTLYTQDDRRRIIKAHLRIENGTITEISKKKPQISKKTPRLKADGLVILPGFVQAHVHLCQTLFRNQADDLELLDWLSKRIWVMEAAHTEETLYASALLGIHELLSTGTTCILDMGTIRHTSSIYEAVLRTGIRANIGKCLMDHPDTTPRALREPTDQALSEANELFNRWNGRENDRIRVSYAPRFVISCTQELLRGVSQLAREQKAIVHTHASENLKEVQLVKKLVNCNSVEYLHRLGLLSSRSVLAHCIWLNPNEKELLRRTKAAVAHCPSSNLKLASGIAPIPEFRNLQIPVALGADGAPCNNNLNMFTELRLAALLHKPGSGPRTIRAQEALDMATRGGAEALHWKEIGSIEIGKKADLIALDLNAPENSIPPQAWRKLDPEAISSAIVYSTQSSHLKWTIVDGHLLYREGRVVGVNRENLLRQVQAAREKTAHRVIRLNA